MLKNLKSSLIVMATAIASVNCQKHHLGSNFQLNETQLKTLQSQSSENCDQDNFKNQELNDAAKILCAVPLPSLNRNSFVEMSITGSQKSLAAIKNPTAEELQINIDRETVQLSNEAIDARIQAAGNEYMNIKNQYNTDRDSLDLKQRITDHGVNIAKTGLAMIPKSDLLPRGKAIVTAAGGIVNAAQIELNRKFAKENSEINKRNLEQTQEVFRDLFRQISPSELAKLQEETRNANTQEKAVQIAAQFIQKNKNKLVPTKLRGNDYAIAQTEYNSNLIQGLLALQLGQTLSAQKSHHDIEKIKNDLFLSSAVMANFKDQFRESTEQIITSQNEMVNSIEEINKNIQLNNQSILQNQTVFFRQELAKMSPDQQLTALKNDQENKYGLTATEKDSILNEAQNYLDNQKNIQRYEKSMQTITDLQTIAQVLKVNPKIIQGMEKTKATIENVAGFGKALNNFSKVQDLSNLANMMSAGSALVGLFKGGGMGQDPAISRHMQIMSKLDGISDQIKDVAKKLEEIDKKIDKIILTQIQTFEAIIQLDKNLNSFRLSTEESFRNLDHKITVNTEMLSQIMNQELQKCLVIRTSFYNYDHGQLLSIYNFDLKSINQQVKLSESINLNKLVSHSEELRSNIAKCNSYIASAFGSEFNPILFNTDAYIKSYSNQLRDVETEELLNNDDFRNIHLGELLQKNENYLARVKLLIDPSNDVLKYLTNTKLADQLKNKHVEITDANFSVRFSPGNVLISVDSLLNTTPLRIANTINHCTSLKSQKSIQDQIDCIRVDTNALKYNYAQALRLINETIMQENLVFGFNQLDKMENMIENLNVWPIARESTFETCRSVQEKNSVMNLQCLLLKYPMIRKNFAKYMFSKISLQFGLQSDSLGYINDENTETYNYNRLKIQNFDYYFTKQLIEMYQNTGKVNFKQIEAKGDTLFSLGSSQNISKNLIQFNNDNKAIDPRDQTECTLLTALNGGENYNSPTLPICIRHEKEFSVIKVFILGYWEPVAKYKGDIIEFESFQSLPYHTSKYLPYLYHVKDAVSERLIDLDENNPLNNSLFRGQLMMNIQNRMKSFFN